MPPRTRIEETVLDLPELPPAQTTRAAGLFAESAGGLTTQDRHSVHALGRRPRAIQG